MFRWILLSIPLSAGFFFLHPYEEAACHLFTGISPLHLLTPRKSENETYRLLSPARTVRVHELYRLFLPLFREHREYFMTGARSAPSTAPAGLHLGRGVVEAGEHSPPKFWL